MIEEKVRAIVALSSGEGDGVLSLLCCCHIIAGWEGKSVLASMSGRGRAMAYHPCHIVVIIIRERDGEGTLSSLEGEGEGTASLCIQPIVHCTTQLAVGQGVAPGCEASQKRATRSDPG